MKKVTSFAALIVLMIGLASCQADSALSEQDGLYDAACTTCGDDIEEAACTTCGDDIEENAACTTCGDDIEEVAACTTCGDDIEENGQ